MATSSSFRWCCYRRSKKCLALGCQALL